MSINSKSKIKIILKIHLKHKMTHIYLFVIVLIATAVAVVVTGQDTRKANLFSLKSQDLINNWRTFKTTYLKKYDNSSVEQRRYLLKNINL
jgi:hypothetical protein